MFIPTRCVTAAAVLCLTALTPARASTALFLEVPELIGTFVHGQPPISAIVDFGFDYELIPDLYIDITGTGTPGVSSTAGAFPADLLVTVNPVLGGASIQPTVLGPYGETPATYGASNQPEGELHGDLDGGLVGVFPAQFEVIIAYNPEHTNVTTPSTVDIQNVTLTLIPYSPPGGCFGDDGFVGIADLNIVLSNWNQNVTVGDCLQGDHDGDGYVGITDLNAVLGNWNAGTPPGEAEAVPEPAVLVCLGIGSILMLRRRVS